MNFAPYPTELEAGLSEHAVEANRNMYCNHYDSCLDMAVDLGWSSWTCARCPLREQAGHRPQPSAFANARTKEGGWAGG